MTTCEHSTTSWTGRRWMTCLVLAFTAQLALVFWLADYSLVTPRPARPSTRVRFSLESPPEQRAGEPLNDPTLFALVTSRGFSGPAWLSLPPLQYQFTNPPVTPHWLGPPVDDLVDDFDEFLQTSLMAEETLSGRLGSAFTEMKLPSMTVVAGTRVTLEGELANRGLVPGQAWPMQPEPILTNTVARVLVDGAGHTVSATLLARSGVAKADQEALLFAKQARFAPLSVEATSGSVESNRLVFGNLLFQWYAVRRSNSALASRPP